MRDGLYDADVADPPAPPAERARTTTAADGAVDEAGDRSGGAGRASGGWLGALLGLLVTGVGLGVAELVVGLVRGSSSPITPVGQEFVDATPPWLKDRAIEWFGTNDKLALLVGALVVIAGLGSAIGILAVRERMPSALALTGVVGVLGAWAVLVRPAPSLARLLPTLVGTAASVTVLLALAPLARAAAAGGAAPPPHGEAAGGGHGAGEAGADRRRFLRGAAGAGSLAVVAGVLGRVLQGRFAVDGERASLVLPEVAGGGASSSPVGGGLDVDGITPLVVPTSDFYRIDTALRVPQVRRESWSLSIGGMVDRPMTLSFDDLLARPQLERQITLSCVSNPVGGDLVGNAVWQGVSLADLLREAGVREGAGQVLSRSVDGWTAGSPTEVVLDGRDAMVAIAMNGEPLPAEHGYPARLVVPGLYGYVSATKWVTEIELTRWEDVDGYWIPRGWAKLGPVKTMARIDTPRSGSRAEGTAAVAGVAWAVGRGISAVQVRVDGGPWLDAELGEVPSDDTWRQWVRRVDTSALAPGRHVVEARAVDGAGEVQPERPAPVAPDGAQGYHRTTIVTG